MFDTTDIDAAIQRTYPVIVVNPSGGVWRFATEADAEWFLATYPHLTA